MEKEDEKPTAENPIKVNIIKDKKQMRVTIPAWIVENFRIDPHQYEFCWFIQEIEKNNKGNRVVRVIGTFLPKKKNDKKD